MGVEMIRKRAGGIACGLGLLISTAGVAQVTEAGPLTDAMPERKLLADAPLLRGRTVRVDDIGCVDPGGVGGFKCLKKVGGQLMLIDAAALGRYTAQEIAEDLISDCKGTANIGSRKCRFTVEFDLQSSSAEMVNAPEGTVQRVTLFARQVDFYRLGGSKKKR